MKGMIIDDEPLSITHLENILTEIGGFKSVEKYTDPFKALKAIRTDCPEIAFIDVEMPELDGIKMAEIISNEFPSIHIVFVTAYRDYAVEAFDLNAVDYLLKPVQRDRLLETLVRLKLIRLKEYKTNNKPSRYPMVCCFSSLQFKWSDEVNFIKVSWRTKKARELFAYLVYYRQKVTRKDALVDLLWPHLDFNQGISLLYSAIYQIKRTLKSIDLDIEIISFENTYTLNMNNVKLDVDKWEQKVRNLPPLSYNTLPEHLETIQLYKGDFLLEQSYPWAETEKERLRSIWLHHIKQVSDFLIAHDEFLVAINIYHYVQKIYPIYVESYFILMQLYDKINERNSVKLHYKALKKMLADDFSERPDISIETWYQNWKEKNGSYINHEQDSNNMCDPVV